MRKLSIKSKNLFSAAALALLVTVGAPAIALAHGDDSTVGTTSGSSSGSGSSNVESSSSTDVSVQHSSQTEEMSTTSETRVKVSSEDRDSNKHKAESMIKRLKEETKSVDNAEVRTKKCEDRKSGLETKFTNIAANSLKYQTKVDAIYAKALTYQKTNSLQPAGFAALTAKADAAKLASSASIAVLQDAKPTAVNCSSDTVATDVATFKTAAAQARDDLKAYRLAVKDVLKSLKSEKPAAVKSDETTAPTTSTSTETTTEGTR